jgi:hypothetical protein
VTFTATVTTSGSLPPTGSITFRSGLSILGTAPMNNGAASFTTSTLSVGLHSITATYGGDTNNLQSLSQVLSESIR